MAHWDLREMEVRKHAGELNSVNVSLVSCTPRQHEVQATIPTARYICMMMHGSSQILTEAEYSG